MGSAAPLTICASRTSWNDKSKTRLAEARVTVGAWGNSTPARRVARNRGATGTAVGRESEPPNERALEAVAGLAVESEEAIGGSQHVGQLQCGLLRGHTEVLSKEAMSAAWLEFVAIR